MRLSLPLVALCAIPAAVGIAIPGGSKDIDSNDYDKHDGDHDYGTHKYHHHDKHKYKHIHPYEHIHHVHHKHLIKPCHILTKERVCKDFHGLTYEVEKVIDIVEKKNCGNDKYCWKGVIYHIYKLEHRLDIYDKHIDHTTLKKCFSYDKESYVVDCYLEYADALIRLLKVLKHKSKHLEGEVDRPILTAINSLRSANYALTYEIGRRISCKKTLNIIMEKQGANDGSTKGSVQQAFSKFIYTPLITGEDFENKGSYGNREKKYKGEKGYKKEDKSCKHDDGYKNNKGCKHDDGYKHDEYEHDEYKKDKYKRDEPHYNHLSVRDYRDHRYVDKDNYSLEPSNDNYVHNPYGAYRNLEREQEWKKTRDDEENRAKDLEWYRRSQMKKYSQAWYPRPERSPVKWYSPSRSPYNHYNGNLRWE
ncbi:hypothetical protein ACLX1H_005183 [Fusarium chlamydosporum]